MLWPASGGGFFVCILSSIQAQRSCFSLAGWQKPLPFVHSPLCTAEAAVSASCCTSYRMCRFISTSYPVPPWNLWPLLFLLSPTGAPHWRANDSSWQRALAKGPAAAAARVSGTAESPSSGQTPALPTARLHSCRCRETNTETALALCVVCPFFCACGGWVWVVFSLNYEQEETMCLFPEQQGREKIDSSRKLAKQNF